MTDGCPPPPNRVSDSIRYKYAYLDVAVTLIKLRRNLGVTATGLTMKSGRQREEHDLVLCINWSSVGHTVGGHALSVRSLSWARRQVLCEPSQGRGCIDGVLGTAQYVSATLKRGS